MIKSDILRKQWRLELFLSFLLNEILSYKHHKNDNKNNR